MSCSIYITWTFYYVAVFMGGIICCCWVAPSSTWLVTTFDCWKRWESRASLWLFVRCVKIIGMQSGVQPIGECVQRNPSVGSPSGWSFEDRFPNSILIVLTLVNNYIYYQPERSNLVCYHSIATNPLFSSVVAILVSSSCVTSTAWRVVLCCYC